MKWPARLATALGIAMPCVMLYVAFFFNGGMSIEALEQGGGIGFILVSALLIVIVEVATGGTMKARLRAIVSAALALVLPSSNPLARRSSAIVTPPGAKLRVVVTWFCTAKTAKRVFDPIFADMQAEWLDAEVRGQKWRSRWVCLRGYGMLVTHVLLHWFVGVAHKAFEMWKALS